VEGSGRGRICCLSWWSFGETEENDGKKFLLNPGLWNTKRALELVATDALGPYLILNHHIESFLEGIRYFLPLHG